MEWRGAPNVKVVGGRGDGWIRINMSAAIPQVQLPAGWDAPIGQSCSCFTNVAGYYNTSSATTGIGMHL